MTYWIDTDPGVDDALAIVLAVQEVGARIAGMSSVQGNGPETQSARNLVRLVEATRASGLAQTWRPVLARGSRSALVRNAYRDSDHRPGIYHGSDGLGDVPWGLPRDWEAAYTQLAAHAIREKAREVDDLTIVCLAPLTNLALAIRLQPELPEIVQRVVIMGGSFRVGGNETIAAEFNFIADPEAAQLVLSAGFRELLLVPLDVCDGARLHRAEWQRIVTGGEGSPARRLASDLLANWNSLVDLPEGVGIYDAVAWLLESDQSFADWEELYVAVDARGGVADGASVADWRRRSARRANARVAVHIRNRHDFVERLMSDLGV